MNASASGFGSGRDGDEEELPTRPTQVVEPATRDHGVLVETTGLFAGRSHAIPPEGATIGRSVECVVRVADEALSRVHARVMPVGNDYVLEDMGSLNGCFVGERRVERAVLRDGDRVRLASNFAVRFNLLSPEEERAMARVYEAGLRDPLTGLANRKHLEETLRAELSFAVRHGTELVVVMADVDRFKRVNDTYGHLVGDTVLRHVAQVFSSAVRTEDIVARFGGEEFVVVARNVSAVGGRRLAERLRASLESHGVRVQSKLLQVTASFGVASLRTVRDASIAGLLECADERMYAAKASGRNRVVGD